VDGGADPLTTPRPDPTVLISAKELPVQRVAFVGIVGALALGTALSVAALDAVEGLLGTENFALGARLLLPVPLGLAFAAAGAAHFALRDVFEGITPPRGTWGLWEVPAPGAELLGLTYAQYHSYWTGTVEIVFGLALALSGLGLAPVPVQLPAAVLLLLTICVTPANIYMFTHDAQMGPSIPPLKYPESHLLRGAVQMLLLAVWWKLATLP
jgi:uncharacterized membrane protein